MPEVDVLKEILDWSQSRPTWQRDALRRLVSNGELSEADLDELAEICKGDYGLVEKQKATPLEAKHLPKRSGLMKPVRLQSLTHHDGVNALGKDQTVEFGTALTVVYGANAAGKSGYTRILKQACRARGAEEILGNVVSGTAPGRPSATVRFQVGDDSKDVLWGHDRESDSPLGRVSVFDRHCASVYIAEKTDVAFRPLGLDLFDKLSDACESVRKALERERRSLAAPDRPIVPNIAMGTKVHEVLSHLTSLSDPEAIRMLATFSEEEVAELAELRKKLNDAKAAEPEKEARILNLRAKRLDSLVAHAVAVLDSLSQEAIKRVFQRRQTMSESGKLTEQLRSQTFSEQPLPNTGSIKWRELWSAAEAFSKIDAYPGQPFPVTDGDALCVLCQQELRGEGAERLKTFQEFLASAIQQEHDSNVREYRKLERQLSELVTSGEDYDFAIEELRVEDPGLADVMAEFLRVAEERRTAVLKALEEGELTFSGPELPALSVESLTTQSKNLAERARALGKETDAEATNELKANAAELEAREQLSKHVDAVI